jgi:hypothetical protein
MRQFSTRSYQYSFLKRFQPFRWQNWLVITRPGRNSSTGIGHLAVCIAPIDMLAVKTDSDG